MKPPVPTLLVTHRGYGEGLLAAAAAILGSPPEIDHLTNDGLSPDTLCEAIERWLDAHGPDSLVLTDLAFGSCGQSARLAARDRPEMMMVAGVSLPMILALLRAREHADAEAFLRHLRGRSQESIQAFIGGHALDTTS